MSVTAVTKKTFEKEILQSQKPVMVDFWASWCGPCKMFSPVVDQIAKERTDIKVCKIDIDSEPELAEKFGVMSIPNVMLFKGGKVAKSSVGFRPKDSILEILGL